MNLTERSSLAPSLRRLPFLIRLAPQLVDRLSAVSTGNTVSAAGEIAGLLLGVLETDFALLQASRQFPAASAAMGEKGTESFLRIQVEILIAAGREDPELAG